MQKNTAPASRRRATPGVSSVLGVAAVEWDPMRIGQPVMAKMSLIATGTPSSGPNGVPRRQRCGRLQGQTPPLRFVQQADGIESRIDRVQLRQGGFQHVEKPRRVRLWRSAAPPRGRKASSNRQTCRPIRKCDEALKQCSEALEHCAEHATTGSGPQPLDPEWQTCNHARSRTLHACDRSCEARPSDSGFQQRGHGSAFSRRNASELCVNHPP